MLKSAGKRSEIWQLRSLWRRTSAVLRVASHNSVAKAERERRIGICRSALFGKSNLGDCRTISPHDGINFVIVLLAYRAGFGFDLQHDFDQGIGACVDRCFAALIEPLAYRDVF